MKEIVVISGKGGTGKTSLVSCFAALAENKVLADCDVDAADLHLILKPRTLEATPFHGGKQARIRPEACTGCGDCARLCRFEAIFPVGPPDGSASRTYRVEATACEGCGVCAWFCPEDAINFGMVQNGESFVSETAYGTLVHAKLGVAEENSGKLVSTVRTRAKEIAEEQDCDLVIIDGAPGVGCPVIASVTNVDLALIVTEPTLSGRHDLRRVLELLRHFAIPGAVLVNKSDINPEMAAAIRDECVAAGIPVVGDIGYTREFVQAMIAGKSLVEYSDGPVAAEVRSAWLKVCEMMSDGFESGGEFRDIGKTSRRIRK